MALDLRSMLKSGLYSDVTINVDKEKIKAHKNILSERCPVFALMLSCDMAEKATDTINIDDMDVDVVKALLRFIYSGVLEETLEVVRCLIYAADKYGLDDLLKKCEEELATSLTVDNAAEYLRLADLHHARRLKDTAVYFIRSNLKPVQLTAGWKTLMEADAKLIISTVFTEGSTSEQDLLSTNCPVTECNLQVKVFKAMFKWRIINYSFVDKPQGKCIESPPFACSDNSALQWTLRYYPLGPPAGGIYAAYAGIALKLHKSPVPSVKTEYKITLHSSVDNNTRRVNNEGMPKEIKVDTSTDDCSTWLLSLDKNVLINKNSGYLQDNTLEFSCEITASLSGILTCI